MEGDMIVVEARDSIGATTRSVAPWVALLLIVVAVGLSVNDESTRDTALRTVLALTAVAEATAGFTYVFLARRMAERGGRPYAAAYHGVMQDFGFYNLTMALLLLLCAADPASRLVVLWAAIALYSVHGATHLLRCLGYYYGGETRVPTRPPHLELRDAMQLLVALAGMLVFYPAS
jgi:hypothetical protein